MVHAYKGDTMKAGQRIHVDTDNKEWGRVASDATVIEVNDKEVLANVDSIRADIFIPIEDVFKKTP
jgi:hypothetical protein